MNFLSSPMFANAFYIGGGVGSLLLVVISLVLLVR
jgi:hypothetical protein